VGTEWALPDAEASRRYLLESRALDPERQSLLLVLSGLELRRPRAVVAPVFCLLYGIACFSDARLAPVIVRSRTGQPSNGPLTQPWLARNSSMTD
jgi:hypothetical protein